MPPIPEKLIKQILIGILIIAALVAAWIYGKRLINYLFPPDPAGAVNTGNLTYTIAEYEGMADRMETAMSGAGTDEATIFSIINQMLTGDDLKQLINSFGIRHKGTSFFGDEWTLAQWLTDELSSSDLAAVENRFEQLSIPF